MPRILPDAVAIPLLAALNDPANSVPPPFQPLDPVVVYPRVEMIEGVHYKLRAPLNASYAPTQEEHAFGGQGRVLDDPSNGWRVNMSLRSDDGFPLFYAIGMDVDRNLIAVGQPAVLRFIRPYLTPEQLAKNEADWEAAMRKLTPAHDTEMDTDASMIAHGVKRLTASDHLHKGQAVFIRDGEVHPWT